MAVALREDDSLDFYSDFRHVDSSNKGDRFTEIATDFKQFYIKKWTGEKTKKVDTPLGKIEETVQTYEVFKCALQWRNRIGRSS